MIVVLLVAIFTVHLPNGFSSIKLMSYDAARTSASPEMKRTCLILRDSLRFALEARAPCRRMAI